MNAIYVLGGFLLGTSTTVLLTTTHAPDTPAIIPAVAGVGIIVIGTLIELSNKGKI